MKLMTQMIICTYNINTYIKINVNKHEINMYLKVQAHIYSHVYMTQYADS